MGSVTRSTEGKAEQINGGTQHDARPQPLGIKGTVSSLLGRRAKPVGLTGEGSALFMGLPFM